jgi:hypothetical protein
MKEILVKYNDEYGTHWYHDELIQCEDCEYYDDDRFCRIQDNYDMTPKDFCSKADRKEE